MKLISVVTPCFNERGNVAPLHAAIREVFAGLPGYEREHIFIDNDSTDGTADELRSLAALDPKTRVILNARNFGHIRSPHYGLLQARGDAAILIAADFQDPPAMISQFVAKWEEGYKLVLGIKDASDEPRLMLLLRNLYYSVVNRLSDVPLTQRTTGFGIYDRSILNILREIDDPYPYFRGLICEIGFKQYHISYHQPLRRKGITKNNFYTLYDLAMLGITNHSKIPLRIAAMAGFIMGGVSLLVAGFYLAAKLLFWNQFSAGIAPIAISIFFLASVQLFFIGLLGEYIGAILTQVQKRPLVIERERINYPDDMRIR